MELAAHIGSVKPRHSVLDPARAPLEALHTALRGMVDASGADAAISDAAAKNTAAGEAKTPHTTGPVLAVVAKAGMATVAGQDVQMAAGETITLGSGENTQWAVAGTARIHTGQAIGVLAGAIKPGAEAAGKGLTLMAGRGDVEVQAQDDAMQVAAKNEVAVQSASSHVDFAAAKRIVMSTAGGANITLEGGNITVQCPGKITIKAGRKSFVSGEKTEFVMPVLPHQDNSWLQVAAQYNDAWTTAWPQDAARLDLNSQTIAPALPVHPR